MRAATWIISCLSLLVLSEGSQIVLSNEAEKVENVKCHIGSFRDVHVKSGLQTLQMQAEGAAYNWKLGYDGFSDRRPPSKRLKLDVITRCYHNYCKALFKETAESGGYYLYMHTNGYIYETSSTTYPNRYFTYSYDPKRGKCTWSNQVMGRNLLKSASGIYYFVVGGDTGDYIFDTLDLEFW